MSSRPGIHEPYGLVDEFLEVLRQYFIRYSYRSVLVVRAFLRKVDQCRALSARPYHFYHLSRYEFAFKLFYEAKIDHMLLLEKRKWEDFVFELVKSKINSRQDLG